VRRILHLCELRDRRRGSPQRARGAGLTALASVAMGAGCLLCIYVCRCRSPGPGERLDGERERSVRTRGLHGKPGALNADLHTDAAARPERAASPTKTVTKWRPAERRERRLLPHEAAHTV
jgi:hypothetical protein